MAYTFNFPDVGEGIHEGRVVEWLVAAGDTVVEDQPLLKVETDKAVVELPSPKAGTVLELHVDADATIEVGDALVTIGEAGESAGAGPVSREPRVSSGPAAAPEEGPAQVPSGRSPASARRPLATPRTRMRARRHGVDLGAVEGTGPGGRITDEDVDRASAAPAPEPALKVAQTPPRREPRGTVEATSEGEVERLPVSHLRKVIANAMRASKQTSAHVTHVDEADVTELYARYREAKAAVEADGGRFTLLPFFVKALVTALKMYPMFNASVDEDKQEILLKRYYNIGIAVDTPEGLVVPVIRHADRKNMVELAAEVDDLAARARRRELRLDEMRGGTCTITNIGPLGGIFATPIINQPELAIVGLHKIQDRPVVVDGEVVVRKMMYLSVSFDHRWIDGAEAARFMCDLVRLVSSPGLLMARL